MTAGNGFNVLLVAISYSTIWAAWAIRRFKFERFEGMQFEEELLAYGSPS